VREVSQEIENLFERLTKKLTDLEERLRHLESEKVILDEKKVISEPKEIGGKVCFSLSNGGVKKRLYIPVCDLCGAKLDEENFFICRGCGKKLCQNCAFNYNNAYFCSNCLQNVLPLTKQDYKVLVSIANGIDNFRKISEITKLRKEDVRNSIKTLIDSGMVEKEGISIFSKLCITDKGFEAIGIYRKVYGKDDDIIQFGNELRRFLNEKS